MPFQREVPRRWFTPAEAAEYANQQGYPDVTPAIIRANVRLELLPAYAIGPRNGHAYRLLVDDINEWLPNRSWEEGNLLYTFVQGRWVAEFRESAQ
ncbi:hypothetical protein [Mycobacterium colombiense]|uniref:hypothetical protein n=1 Tax=Mycobacterium colombiense TaxID=339268 RepID=UPI00096D8C4C|nr:hypothetical protein [Mycobacterium colombiense]OMB93231.1 hypothetical protein A5732_16910 [Mycobacterium colombiense]